jgi:hypothetical protein
MRLFIDGPYVCFCPSAAGRAMRKFIPERPTLDGYILAAAPVLISLLWVHEIIHGLVHPSAVVQAEPVTPLDFICLLLIVSAIADCAALCRSRECLPGLASLFFILSRQSALISVSENLDALFLSIKDASSSRSIISLHGDKHRIPAAGLGVSGFWGFVSPLSRAFLFCNHAGVSSDSVPA